MRTLHQHYCAFMRRFAEKQTCGRRLNDWGPWDRSPNLDRWERTRWGTSIGRRVAWWWHNGWPGKTMRALYNAAHAHGRALRDAGKPSEWWYRNIVARCPSPYSGGTKWQWPWQPRTCSFCGGAHPEDVIKLVQEGWEVEWSDKRYKAYVQPPGHREQTRQIMDHLSVRERVPLPQGYWSPVPPVKAYFQHWTEEQYKRLIDVIKARIAA